MKAIIQPVNVDRRHEATISDLYWSLKPWLQRRHDYTTAQSQWRVAQSYEAAPWASITLVNTALALVVLNAGHVVIVSLAVSGNPEYPLFGLSHTTTGRPTPTWRTNSLNCTQQRRARLVYL